MRNIIGLCGRCRGGKTELANICVELGYEKLSFAKHLKQLVADIIQCTIDEVNNLKTANFNYTCSKNDCEYISKECKIPYEFVEKLILDKVFHNTRDMLQYIGTNVIRKYNNNWHVDKTREILNEKPNTNFVIDDVRFENEVHLIQELNGDCWFVVRPLLDNVSNHESENTLQWQNFENIIINDGKLEYLKFRWKTFVENDYNEQMKRKKELTEFINNSPNTIKNIIENNDNISTNDMLFVSKHLFTYNPMFFQNYDIQEVKHENNKNITVKIYDNVYQINNPLEIEDIKLYI